MQILEYLDERGRSPFAAWFEKLSPSAAARVATALYRLESGNLSKVEGVGKGVFERKIDLGPGYRVYFGKDGGTAMILLGGGSKQRQREAIAASQERWADYKRRRGAHTSDEV